MLQNTKAQCPVPCPLGGMGWGKAGPDLGWAEGWLAVYGLSGGLFRSSVLDLGW